MNKNGSGPAAPSTSPADSGCSIPWCTLNHADPVFDSDCHIGDVAESADLGLTLSTTDGAPVTVDILWDHTRESLQWTPAQARQAAITLLQLAEAADATFVPIPANWVEQELARRDAQRFPGILGAAKELAR